MTALIVTHNDRQGEPLPHARLHDLRHVHATTLLLAGVPVHVVAAGSAMRTPRSRCACTRTSSATSSPRPPTSSPAPWRLPARVPLLASVLAKEPLPDLERGSELGALGGTRTPNLLSRRFQCGRPDPFRSVRDLGRFTVHCSLESGFPRNRPSGWLPAWLPGNTGSRLQRPPTLSREFVRSACLHPLAAARPGQDHSA